MSFASGTRSYFKDRITECFPDYDQWADFFNVDNIPSQNIDCRYHIELGSTSTEKNDQAIFESMSVTIRFFKKSFSDSILEDFDELYDCVHAFKLNAQDPSKHSGNSQIFNVEGDSITPQPLDASNDNLLQLDISFTVQSYWNC